MKKITAEGIPLYYYTATDDLNEKPNDKAVLYYLPHRATPAMASLIAGSANMRLVLVEGWPNGITFESLVLFDYEGESLNDLDEKVRTDTYTDADFEKLLYTTYHRRWGCRSCGWTFPVLLYAYSMAYPPLHRLAWERYPLERLKRCPNCDKTLAHAIKIFPAEQIPWPDPWPRRS